MIVTPAKKRHHFVPAVYLKGFCDPSGRVTVYLKDNPRKPHIMSPDSTAIERYYYSQPLRGGGMDHNSLEDFFSKYETEWPGTVARVHMRENSPELLQALLDFVSLMKVRVPATRDMVETSLAGSVLTATKFMDQLGLLPPKPPGHEDILEQVAISIDPHKSLHAMPDLLFALERILSRLGFEIVSDRTGIGFLTTDNPVVYFDPTVTDYSLKPYVVQPSGGHIEFLFPIDATTLLRGTTDMRSLFALRGFSRRTTDERNDVKRVNRLLARFGYRMVFANGTQHGRLIEKYASTSPVVRSATIDRDNGKLMISEMVFGPRPIKPKWHRPPSADEMAGIESGLRDAASGRFVTEEQVEDVFEKYRPKP